MNNAKQALEKLFEHGQRSKEILDKIFAHLKGETDESQFKEVRIYLKEYEVLLENAKRYY